MQPNHSATLLTILWGISAFTISATISLTAQGAAGYLNQNKPNGSSKSGLALLKASLVLLLVCIVSFLAFLELFRRRLSAIEVDATQTKRIRFIVFCPFYRCYVDPCTRHLPHRPALLTSTSFRLEDRDFLLGV